MNFDNSLNDALVAFGANQGDCEKALHDSLELLKQDPATEEITVAKPILTKAVTGKSAESAQADYLNSAFWLRTTLKPRKLHRLLISIEEKLGRERLERWGPRSVDLDLILYSDTIMKDDTLQIPHPRMSFRRFVLQPAVEVAGEMVDPRSGMTLSQLLQHVDSKENTVLLATNQSAQAAELVQNMGCDDFVFVVTQEAASFITNASTAKLLVSWIHPDQESPLNRYAQNFAGPLLNVDGRSMQDAQREIMAAIEAMRPLFSEA